MRINRRIIRGCTVIAMLMVCAPVAFTQIGPRPVVLWDGPAPGATGDSAEDTPAVYPYLPEASKSTGAAMLVIPGGGFMTRVTDHEGVLVAQWLRSRGIAAFVLRYRIRPVGDMAASIHDAQRAMQFIRSRAGEYKIATDRIGIIGFSAGAELAAAVSFQPVPAAPDAKDPVDHFPTQANFVVLAYGSTNGQPAANMAAPFPPAFMFCTAEDTGHINGMLTLYSTLRRACVPVEAHFFANGEHGVGLAQGDPILGEWPELMFNRIRAGGFLVDARRVGVKGLVMLDGEALPRGVVSFTPIGSNAAPAGVGYIFNTGPVRGEFYIAPSQGLVPGKYRVEVHQYGLKWMSNSRDPFMVEITRKLRGGLSAEDQATWLEFARQRDLSPTIEDERVFTKFRPTDKDEMVVEIRGGEENQINLEVFSK